MKEAVKTLAAIYLPFGRQQFSEEKVAEALPDVTARYFLSFPRKENKVYQYYDTLEINMDTKARVQHMGSLKKRFTKAEAEAMFNLWNSQ